MTPREGFVYVTPEVAANWRLEHHYHGQRAFRQWHADNLSDEMRAGRFRPKTQVSFAECDGKLYCTNGQHTLAAIEQSGTTQLISVVINHCESMQEVADDFARHDTHLTRRFSDSLAAHDVHTMLGVTHTQLQYITAACIYYTNLIGANKYRSSTLTHDNKMKIVQEYGELGRDALAMFEGSPDYVNLTRKTVIASAMLTLKHQPEIAPDFWRVLAMDDGLRISDPRKQLLIWLRDHVTVGGAAQARVGRKPTADHEFVKAVSAGWNAWLSCREIKFIRVDFNAPFAQFDRIGSFRVRSDYMSKKVINLKRKEAA